MAIPKTVLEFLDRHGASYTLKRHLGAGVATRVAETAHISGECVVKGVLMEHAGSDYRVIALPAARHIDIVSLHLRFGELWGLATEEEIRRLFPDCESGMVPVPAVAYGVDVMLDNSITEVPRVYFEVGDTTTLARMNTTEFLALFPTAERGDFSRHL